MDRGSCSAELGNGGSKMVPGEIEGVGDDEKNKERSNKAAQETNSRRGWSGIGHKARGVFCPGRSCEAR